MLPGKIAQNLYKEIYTIKYNVRKFKMSIS